MNARLSLRYHDEIFVVGAGYGFLEWHGNRGHHIGMVLPKQSKTTKEMEKKGADSQLCPFAVLNSLIPYCEPDPAQINL